MRNASLYLLTFCLALSGCGKDEDLVDASENWSSNEKLNHWVYAQMKHHYFWTEDIPEESELDFKLNLTQFYASIKSSHDRFSYFEANIGYNGSIDDIASLSEGGGLTTPSPQGLDTNYVYEYADAFPDLNYSSIIDTVYVVGAHVVGYMYYRHFEDKEELLPVLRKFKSRGVTDVVIDLRMNGGGLVDTAVFLSSCLIPEEWRGTDAEYLVYNPTVTMETYGTPDGHGTYRYFSTEGLRNCDLNIAHAYFIVGPNTASASESTIFMVKAYTPTTLIGTTTVGKGVGMYTIRDKNYPYQLVPITFKYYNALWESVPDDGIIPDYVLEEEMSSWRMKDIGTTDEPLLAKVLGLIASDDFSNDNVAKNE